MSPCNSFLGILHSRVHRFLPSSSIFSCTALTPTVSAYQFLAALLPTWSGGGREDCCSTNVFSALPPSFLPSAFPFKFGIVGRYFVPRISGQELYLRTVS